WPRGECARAQADGGRVAGGGHHLDGDRGPRSPTRPPLGEAHMIAFLAQTLRIAMPYLFASAGGVVSERAGLIALTLEGYMLIAAFCAALGSYFGGGPWAGVLAGIGGGVATALLYGLCSIRYRANQVVVGIAINLLAIGLTRFFLRLTFD